LSRFASRLRRRRGGRDGAGRRRRRLCGRPCRLCGRRGGRRGGWLGLHPVRHRGHERDRRLRRRVANDRARVSVIDGGGDDQKQACGDGHARNASTIGRRMGVRIDDRRIVHHSQRQYIDLPRCGRRFFAFHRPSHFDRLHRIAPECIEPLGSRCQFPRRRGSRLAGDIGCRSAGQLGDRFGRSRRRRRLLRCGPFRLRSTGYSRCGRGAEQRAAMMAIRRRNVVDGLALRARTQPETGAAFIAELGANRIGVIAERAVVCCHR